MQDGLKVRIYINNLPAVTWDIERSTYVEYRDRVIEIFPETHHSTTIPLRGYHYLWGNEPIHDSHGFVTRADALDDAVANIDEDIEDAEKEALKDVTVGA